MAGPTAAESLIKAAAAGEGARKGGGARRKGWKEVGGSAGLRPPTQSRRARRTREPGPPGVQDQASRVDPGPAAVDMGLVKSPACWRSGKNRGLKEHSRADPRLALPSRLWAWRCLPGSALASWRPSLGPPHSPSSAHLSVSQRGSNIPARNEGSDSCLCGRAPHFINWRLELAHGGGDGGAKGGGEGG